MNLPNYFIADLPPEAVLKPDMIQDACQTLKHNRERYLKDRPTESLIRALSETSMRWLQADSPFRLAALESGPEATGFSKATLARGLDDFFSQLTAQNLETLVEQDLGHPRRLDEFSGHESEHKTGRTSLARGPELITHICAGNIPNPALINIVVGVLLRSSQFVKCASGAAFLPR